MHTQKFLKLGDMLKIEIIAEMCAVYCKGSSKLYCSCLYVGQFLLTLYFFYLKILDHLELSLVKLKTRINVLYAK